MRIEHAVGSMDEMFAELDATSSMRVIVPAMRPDLTVRCIDSVVEPGSAAGFRRDELLIVDNSRHGLGLGWSDVRVHRDPEGHNLGVAGSWNVGAREVLDGGLDYLVVLSTSVQFGPELHCTFRTQMYRFWGDLVIEASGHSWHLIAFHRSLFEQVGLFDENFYPAYEEAIDFGYRMRLLDLEKAYEKVWVNAISWGSANHVDEVHCPNPPLVKYYVEKWGGVKGDEKWLLPYGDKPIDYWEKRSIPEMAERYGLTDWW